MDTVTIFANRTCNQRCGFCTFRRAHDEPGTTSAGRIRAEIDQALRAGASNLVLTGGEPTLVSGLASHIAYASRRGLRVTLETNGMAFAYAEHARALAATGVHQVRVAVNTADPHLSDELTERPGGLALTLRGIENLLAHEVRVEISTAIVRPSLPGLPALVEWLQSRLPAIEGLLLRVVTDAGPEWVAPYPEIATTVMAAVTRARETGLNVRLDGRNGIPLCFFPERSRFPELFATGAPREQHGFERIEACGACEARGRCPGVPTAYLAIHGAEDARAVPHRQARLVAGLGRDRLAAVESELVNESFSGVDGGLERVLRVNFHCNQACDFCFVDRALPAVPYERLEREIDRAVADGVTLLSLSGGEPTLHPRLPDLLRRARETPLRVQLQTNAVRCAEPSVLEPLLEAGLEAAFVSLHGSTAALSDALTGAPGTFQKTLEGIDAMVDAGVAVMLNCVITGESFRALPEHVRFIANRWGDRVDVNLSIAHASTDLVPKETRIVPRLSDLRPHVREAVATLRAAGIRHRGFDGQCGMPLCLVEASWLDRESLAPLPEPNPPPGFFKPAACRACSLDDRCVGLRDSYVALYGSGELRPLMHGQESAPPPD